MCVIFHPQSGPTSGSGKTNCSKKWYWCYSGNCILTVTMLCVDPENIISVAWLQFPLNIHISIQYLMYCSVNDFFLLLYLKKISIVLNIITLFLFLVSIVFIFLKNRILYFKLITAQPGVNEKKLISVQCLSFSLDLCEMCLQLCFSF